MFVAADVHYLASGGARAAAVLAADAAFSRLAGDRIAVVPDVEPYRPGQFYLRELPPLRAALDGLTAMTLLVIDGYADLDPDGRPGLGARAHDEFGVPVIGVAKSPFHRHPRHPGAARHLGPAAVRHRRRDAPRRRRLPRPAHGRPPPDPRCPPPRRYPSPPRPAPASPALNELPITALIAADPDVARSSGFNWRAICPSLPARDIT